MGQLALTFWFTVATLFGPSLLCCCGPATAASPKAVAAPKPLKSCCGHAVAPTDPEPAPAPTKEKPKCPCQSKVSAEALLAGVESTDELATQSRTADAAFAELSPIPFDSIRTSGGAVPSLPTSPRLSGRALLAAYSTLRC